ncbi:DotU family type IV/VI secretion system protein [Thalassolituus sp. TTPB476]|jgi:type VI secretion system protein ImpK|nr:DotU family type IV/VI secretion system protein [Thalassolituus alkanivorans]
MDNRLQPTATAATQDYGDPVQLMSDFYRQVVEVKFWVRSGRLNDEVAAQFNLNRAPSGEEITEAVALRLQRWVEKTRLNAAKTLTERECERVEQTLFVLVALADELFIMELDWPGKEHWQEQPLEERVFSSCFAGERFFTGAAALLADRSWDQQEQKLASVYLFALRLGFAGRYRGDAQRLGNYRALLFKRISSGAQPGLVCPNAYQHVLASRQERRLAPLAAWYRMMALGAAAYLVLGWVIWLTFKGHWG